MSLVKTPSEWIRSTEKPKRSKIDKDFSRLCKLLKDKYKPSRVFDKEEPNFKNDVRAFLNKNGFPDAKSHLTMADADVQVGKIAIELKLPRSIGAFDNINKHIIRFNEFYTKIIVFVYDQFKIVPKSEIDNLVDEYIKQYPKVKYIYKA